MTDPVIAQASLYDRVGGMAFFEDLVGRFYAAVADDPILRPLYPEADLGPAQRRLTLFLAQYWGGPRTYDDERGHPRLRMRHVPFADRTGRARPLARPHARGPGRGQPAPPADAAAELDRYLEMAADAMQNRAGD